jgi:hypothetical protein
MTILRANRARRPNHFFDVVIYSIRINAVQHDFSTSPTASRRQWATGAAGNQPRARRQ